MSGGIKIAAVVGATASGKTALAVALAQRLDGEVISADSMQIYQGLSISTAKPTPEEQQGIPHHLIDFVPLQETFSVAHYCELAHQVIADVTARGRLPIVCGGTGLYVDSLLNNLLFPDIPENQTLRDALTAEWEQYGERGGKVMLERLTAVDPETAARLHPADRKRILRALEVFTLTGVTLSEWNRRSRSEPDRYRSIIVGLGWRNRQTLYDRIDRRVDDMLAAGLIEEARRFYAETNGKTAVQAIGCKELLPFLRGEEPLQTAVERLKRETRRLAKRQLTWFRRNDKIEWIYADDYDTFDALAARAEEVIRQSPARTT
ncbi:MAG: tRNA (adenosine(37)-N6)-dimethylallyltransferase MiaA [Clostridia bacterium]|nr:tRNA (adenosine(37)-N6)-dimethylallyltransferase MiaA [Clostridia bacterium]